MEKDGAAPAIAIDGDTPGAPSDEAQRSAPKNEAPAGEEATSREGIAVDPMLRELMEPRGGGERAIDGYEIIKAIGKGKFAIVYRAKRLVDGTIVALKKILIENMDAKARNKCLKEVRLLQSLNHPNIVAYLDSFIEGNELIIVFEWAESGDLKRQVRKAQERQVRFEERVIWKYFAQMCEAIRHMHERRIMHRDLKPANIFLTLNGTVKVGDLGLGREMSEHTVEAHSKVGTPLYMSPEVLRGDGYDFRSDIWSVGCLLYELAMLKSPFKAEGLNLYSLFQKISKADYQPLPEHYSQELRDLAYSMINIDPNCRPNINEVCAKATAMRQKTSSAAAQAKRLQQQQQQEKQEKETVTQQQTVDGAREPNYCSNVATDQPLETKENIVACEGALAAPNNRGGWTSEGKDKKGENNSKRGQEHNQVVQPQASIGASKSSPVSNRTLHDSKSRDAHNHFLNEQQQQPPPQISRSSRGSLERTGGVHTMIVSPAQKIPLQQSPSLSSAATQDKPGMLNGRKISHVTLAAMEELYHKMEMTGYSDARRGLLSEIKTQNSKSPASGRREGRSTGKTNNGGQNNEDDEDDFINMHLPPLLQTHFALPAEAQQQGARNSASQFGDLVHAAHWHFSRLGLVPKYFDGSPQAVELTPPIVIAQQLLAGLQAAQFPIARASAIKPATLVAGWGDTVVEVLTFLVDQVLVKKLSSRGPVDVWTAQPCYDFVADTSAIEGHVAVEESPDDLEVIDDDAESVEDDFCSEDVSNNDHGELLFGRGDRGGVQGFALSMSHDAEDQHDRGTMDRAIINATVDKGAWRLELERIAPRLRQSAITPGSSPSSSAASPFSSNSPFDAHHRHNTIASDWSIRLKAIRRHIAAYEAYGLFGRNKDQIQAALQFDRSSERQHASMLHSGQDRLSASDASTNVRRLSSFGKFLENDCGQLRRKEQHLVEGNSNLLLLGREYLDLAEEGVIIKERMARIQKMCALNITTEGNLNETLKKITTDIKEKQKAATNTVSIRLERQYA